VTLAEAPARALPPVRDAPPERFDAPPPALRALVDKRGVHGPQAAVPTLRGLAVLAHRYASATSQNVTEMATQMPKSTRKRTKSGRMKPLRLVGGTVAQSLRGWSGRVSRGIPIAPVRASGLPPQDAVSTVREYMTVPPSPTITRTRPAGGPPHPSRSTGPRRRSRRASGRSKTPPRRHGRRRSP
jgi:hypothetical protein